MSNEETSKLKELESETGLNLLTSAWPYIHEEVDQGNIDRMAKWIDSYLQQLKSEWKKQRVEKEVPEEIELTICEYINDRKTDFTFDKLVGLGKYCYGLSKKGVPDITVYRWVKAVERLPAKRGIENQVIIRNTFKNAEFVTTGFTNYNENEPSIYFVLGCKSYLTIDGKGNGNSTYPISHIEWLEPIKLPSLLNP